MKPTIGRIVHFRAPDACGGEVYAAIVTAVHEVELIDGGPSHAPAPSLTLCDLATFGPASLYFHQGVPHADAPPDVLPKKGRWSWPPMVGGGK